LLIRPQLFHFRTSHSGRNSELKITLLAPIFKPRIELSRPIQRRTFAISLCLFHANASPPFTAKAHRPSKADFPFFPFRVFAIPSPRSNPTKVKGLYRDQRLFGAQLKRGPLHRRAERRYFPADRGSSPGSFLG
jgi:hypothetical protein